MTQIIHEMLEDDASLEAQERAHPHGLSTHCWAMVSFVRFHQLAETARSVKIVNGTEKAL